MLTFLGRRLLAIVPLLIIVSFMVYGLIILVPGDAAQALAGENATAEMVEETRERLGLNDPFIVQYARWAGGALRGDLGTSLFSSQTVMGAIVDRMPITLTLTFASIVIALIIAVPAGMTAALNKGGWVDRLTMLGATAGVALPNFWLGLVLVLAFATLNPWLPATGYVGITENPGEWAKHILLPAIALGAAAAAEITRQLRSALIDVLEQDYVRTARAKGLRTPVVVGKHVLKNAAVPVVTVLGLQISRLLGGTVVIEQVFGLPGLGSLAVKSVFDRDAPMILGIVMMAVLVAVVVNLLVDISYGWFNPRVRPR